MATLVTGGFGAIGSWAVRELVDHGEEVVVMARNDQRHRMGFPQEVRFEAGDVSDPHRVYDVVLRTRVRRICHLAARLSIGADSYANASFATNVAGTVNLLEAARLAGIEKFVYASSKAVYGPPQGAHAFPTYQPVSEAAPIRPADVYGTTKAAGELMVEEYARTSGLPAISLRFGSTFGPGKTSGRHGSFGIVSSMIEAAAAGKPFRTAGSDQVSDYIYYGDASVAIRRALDADVDGYHCLNIATGRGLSLAEVANAVSKACPHPDIQLAGGLTYREGQPSMAFVLNVERACKVLGFTTRFTFEQAVADYVKRLQ